MNRSSATRILTSMFVVSVVINAVLGIWALLSGDFGETEGKILGTSFLVSAAMLSVLINAPAIRRRVLWPAPVLGAVTGAAGFTLFIIFMWSEAEAEYWFKLAGSLLVVAAAATLAASLALLSVPATYRWLRLVGYVLLAVLAGTAIFGLWYEPDSEWYARLLGVEGVLVAAFTLLIPVLSRFAPSQAEAVEPEAGVPTFPAVRFCPSCGRPITPAPFGLDIEIDCSTCGLAFVVVSGASGLNKPTDNRTARPAFASEAAPAGSRGRGRTRLSRHHLAP